jgi:tetratricopeptide (TPR) repeat protein
MRTGLATLGLLLLAAAGDAGAAAPPQAAVEFWQLGQEALRDGKVDEAITLYRRSLQIDAELSRNYLSLAAAYSAKGDDRRVVEYLTHYVQLEPDHVAIRSHLAEILLRTQHLDAARVHFERCVADLQERPETDPARLIHCHSRLVELAESSEDEYAERLNRGIGLYLLARQRARLPDSADEPAAQGLLFRAARELCAARQEGPYAARPCWYLHLVWSSLGQQQPSERWLRAAADGPGDLTRVEKADLQTACHQAAVLRGRK